MTNSRKIFSEIYDQYIDQIYRFVFLKVSSQEIAEDLVSETFTRAWESIKGGTDIKNCRAFLYQIARNKVIDHYREKGKNQVVSAELDPIVDPREDLEEKAIFNSDLEVVKKAITNLKDDYQNVIIWHYLDDLPIPEVSKILDKSEDATRVLLHRALKSLKNELNIQSA
jgi:RNA polymerase sigma-70 factor (ECF subfamily)